jgi:hypothetical protein
VRHDREADQGRGEVDEEVGRHWKDADY